MKKIISSFLGAMDKIKKPQSVHTHCDIPCGICTPVNAQLAAQTVEKMVLKLGELQMPKDTVNQQAMLAYLNSVDSCARERAGDRGSVPGHRNVRAHTKKELEGMRVICVVNFLPKKVGPFISEVLTLGFKNGEGNGWVLATPAKGWVTVGDKLR